MNLRQSPILQADIIIGIHVVNPNDRNGQPGLQKLPDKVAADEAGRACDQYGLIL